MHKSLKIFYVVAFIALSQASLAEDGSRQEILFSPMIQRTVADDNPQQGGEFLIDLDSGKSYAPPAEFLRRGFEDAFSWMSHRGIDAMGEGGEAGLIGIDMIVSGAGDQIAASFPNFSEQMVLRRFQFLEQVGKAGTPILLSARAGVGPKATYLFMTREGAKGVLQIAGWDEQTRAVRIHYRLMISSVSRVPLSTTTAEARASVPRDAGALGPVFEKTIAPHEEAHLLDMDSGELVSIGKGDTIDWDGFIRDRSVDLQVKPFQTGEVRFYNSVIVGVPNEWWDDSHKVSTELRWLRPVNPARTILYRSRREQNAPATFLFKTEEGSLGALQIVEWNPKDKTVRIRYRKMSAKKDTIDGKRGGRSGPLGGTKEPTR